MSAPRRSILPASLLLFILFPSLTLAREITFEQRVRAQEAIERVAYSHQIGATRPFEEAVPRALLVRKVSTYLGQSAALERVWHRPITAAMLQKEMERMVARTRMPDRLRELFAALGDDSFLIQECLVRPVLAGRLAEEYAAFDDRLHHGERERAEEIRRALARGAADPLPPDAQRHVVDVWLKGYAPAPQSAASRAGDIDPEEPRSLEVEAPKFAAWRAGLPDAVGMPGSIREERDAFVTPVLLESEAHHLRVALVTVPKEHLSDGWRLLSGGNLDSTPVRSAAPAEAPPQVSVLADSPPCACGSADFWDAIFLSDPPDPRVGHSAVWTGSVMIVWGGTVYLGINTGARYDPVTDTWSAMSTVNAPSERAAPTLFWTGDKVLLWGGWYSCNYCVAYPLNDGAYYDPATDTWTPVSSSGAPPHLRYYSAVWTGSQMLVWGGYDVSLGYSNQGYRLDPSSNAWTPMSVSGAPSPRRGASAVWTGSEMLVWGGLDASGYLGSGGRYDPAGDSWGPLSAAGAPPAIERAFAVWTGDRMVVWTGTAGGRYDPALDSWQGVSTSGAPVSINFNYQSAVWTGEDLILWGGLSDAGDSLNSGARYDPVADTWSPTSTTNAPSPRSGHTAVWDGSEMIVWGGGGSGGYVNTGGRYDPATDTWVPTSTGPGPPPGNAPAVWTGSKLLVWGGSTLGPGGAQDVYLDTGGQYDPALDSWSAITTSGAPSPRYAPLVWTGDVMVVWGGTDGTSRFASGGRYDPVADSWSPTSLAGAPAARSSHRLVWSGREVLVWGGTDGSLPLNSGGRYDPVADTWSPMSTLDAPPGVLTPLAFWTGSRLLVWGGYNQSSPHGVNTGGRYDPVYDVWRPTSPSGLSPRYGATGVWTGSQMIVWGGTDDIYSYFDTGGRYDPVSDQWTPTSLSGAPQGRFGAAAVWTGTRMIVWGGYNDYNESANPFLSTGGVYDPVSDAWAPVSESGAPLGRFAPSAVWTGDRMIVRAGQIGGSFASSGGSYCGVFPPHFYLDADVDGYGDSGSSVVSCSAPPGYVATPGDCSDADAAVWSAPSEVLDLRFDDAVTMEWSAPAQPGASSLLYDVLRSGDPADFVVGGSCLASDSPLLGASDATVPAGGAVLSYLVRAQDGCPSGSGSLGTTSAGDERAGLDCP